MRRLFARLGRNLASGARLAFFLPVTREGFRPGLADLLLLLLVSAGLDFGNDWIRYNPGGYLSLYGAGTELFAAGMLLVTAMVLALAFRRRALVVTIPVVALAATMPVDAVQIAWDALLRWTPVPAYVSPWLETVVLAWLVIVLIRAVGICLVMARGRRWPRALAGGLALAAPLWLAPMLMPSAPWWRQPAVHGGVDPHYPSPASEAVLSAQAQLLDDALGDLEDERPGVTDLYFVAFGGDAAEDVFRKDVEAARRVMDERWDTKDRSVILLNNPRTLLDTPIATVTNLRETLSEIAAAMDPEQDVVMVYLASHGRPEMLDVSLPPLELAPVTPAVLRNLLDEAGITWRIVVVSSCYSGSFIPALQDEHTMVITAAQADRTSFGCGFRSDGTYFGHAFFDEGLRTADSLPAAFELAKQAIAKREADEHASPPSNPQVFVGAAMQDKLKELERGSAARRAGRMVCAACGRFMAVLHRQGRGPRLAALQR